MNVHPTILLPGTRVRHNNSDRSCVLRERKDTDDGWWINTLAGVPSGHLGDHALHTDYMVTSLPGSIDADALMARGALAFIDLLLADDVFVDRDSRPESPRNLESAWRDAGYRQAMLDVYEAVLSVVQARGIVGASCSVGTPSDGSAS